MNAFIRRVAALSLFALLAVLHTSGAASGAKEPASQPRKPPPAGAAGDCTTSGCHDGYAKAKVVHAPVEAGSCDTCHAPVEGDAHQFKRTAEGSALCLECHESVTENLKNLHGPVAAGECTACHNPHASPYAKLLSADERQTCLQCHEDIGDRLTKQKHPHAPVADGCTACHNPHGADNRMNLRSALPALCLDCHEDIRGQMDDSPVKHAAMTTGRSCAGCHDPHASDLPKVMLKPTMELCLTCHNQELVWDTGRVANIAQLLKDRPNHHGPIADDDCTTCHAPHGSTNARLLTSAYPAGFYADFGEKQYALCFGCHESEAFTEEQTSTATAFRNGPQNLHYLHVNRSPKGRTCRACHDPHATAGPKHVAEAVQFGQWRLPVGFTATETGGSCASGCHRPYRYDREKPVTNLPQ